MSSGNPPNDIPGLYEAMMGFREEMLSGFDGVNRRIDALAEDTRQGFVQVNQKLQEVDRRLDRLEGDEAAGGTFNPYPRAAQD